MERYIDDGRAGRGGESENVNLRNWVKSCTKVRQIKDIVLSEPLRRMEQINSILA